MEVPGFMSAELAKCQNEIGRMLRNSQTRIIAPIITFGLLRAFLETQQNQFTDSDIRRCYDLALADTRRILGHDLHIGARYYDAYGSRLSRYGVLRAVGHLKYELQTSFATNAEYLIGWIPNAIHNYVQKKLGDIPKLGSTEERFRISENKEVFLGLIDTNLRINPANFEIFSFAILKIHLEKFACRIYRDTTTAAHDRGVDLSTNFGAVYQLKKLRVYTQGQAQALYDEMRSNFDEARFSDGNVVLVIDDVSKGVKQFLVNMRIQPITSAEIIQMAKDLEECEDRQKVLRIAYDEFRREYGSRT